MFLQNFAKIPRFSRCMSVTVAKVSPAELPHPSLKPIMSVCNVCRRQQTVRHFSKIAATQNLLSQPISHTKSHHPTAYISSQYSTIARDNSSVFGRMWKGLGFTGKLKYDKKILQMSGLRLYLCCVELIEYDKFFKELELPDTFNSWFRVTELHIWLCMVRLAQEESEGKFVRNSLVRYMWEDIDKKSRKLGPMSSASLRTQGIQLLSEQFKSALFTYDEGLLDDDRVLAGALWRQFFEMKCDDPEKLELMVQYVRKQVLHMDHQESGVILTSGLMQFAPLEGEEDKQRTKQILREILRRV